MLFISVNACYDPVSDVLQPFQCQGIRPQSGIIHLKNSIVLCLLCHVQITDPTAIPTCLGTLYDFTNHFHSFKHLKNFIQDLLSTKFQSYPNTTDLKSNVIEQVFKTLIKRLSNLILYLCDGRTERCIKHALLAICLPTKELFAYWLSADLAQLCWNPFHWGEHGKNASSNKTKKKNEN